MEWRGGRGGALTRCLQFESCILMILLFEPDRLTEAYKGEMVVEKLY